MAQTSPALAALVIIVVLVAIVLLVLVLISRQSTVRTSSTPTAADCVGPPATPSGLSASNPQGDLIILDWNDIASAQTYTAYVGDTPGYDVEDAIASRTTSFSSASFANLTLGVTYYFKVKAFNTCGESPLSPELAFNLAFQFPSRFVIANRLNSALKACDSHTNIYFPDDRVRASRFCANFDSWSFYQDVDKTIRQSHRPSYCLTRSAPDSIHFSPCVVSASQQWAYNAQDQTLCSFANPNADCLRMPVPTTQDGGPLRWGVKGSDAVSDWDFEAV